MRNVASATLVISRGASSRSYLARLSRGFDKAAAVLSRLPMLSDQALDAESLEGHQIGMTDWQGPPFGAILLDLHAGFSEADRLTDLMGIRFVEQVRSRGCGVPVVMVSWLSEETLRLRSVHTCPSLFVRYRRSFEFLRHPAGVSEIGIALAAREPLSGQELEEIEELQAMLKASHQRRET